MSHSTGHRARGSERGLPGRLGRRLQDSRIQIWVSARTQPEAPTQSPRLRRARLPSGPAPARSPSASVRRGRSVHVEEVFKAASTHPNAVSFISRLSMGDLSRVQRRAPMPKRLVGWSSGWRPRLAPEAARSQFAAPNSRLGASGWDVAWVLRTAGSAMFWHAPGGGSPISPIICGRAPACHFGGFAPCLDSNRVRSLAAAHVCFVPVGTLYGHKKSTPKAAHCALNLPLQSPGVRGAWPWPPRNLNCRGLEAPLQGSRAVSPSMSLRAPALVLEQ